MGSADVLLDSTLTRLEYKVQFANELLSKKNYLSKNREYYYEYTIDGKSLLSRIERIEPKLHLCTNRADFDIYDFYSLFSSFPSRDRPGRRIKFLLLDSQYEPHKVMAIGCLSSPLWGCAVRDKWIGWSECHKSIKSNKLIYVLDLSTCIGIPPYSYLTSAKLMSMLMLSVEVMDFYKTRYTGQLTMKINREVTQYALITTTSINGKNAPIYRMNKYNGSQLYKYVGLTKGYSTYHISDKYYRKFKAHNDQIKSKSSISNGSNPKIRTLRNIARQNGLDEKQLVYTGEKRGVFCAPVATNYREFL